MKNPNPKQRSDLTAVVSEISGFATLTGSSFAVADQVRASIANLVGSQASRSIDPFGFGVSYALGDRRVLVVRQRDGRVADMSDPELRGILTAGRALAEFELLLSPRPEDMASLRANGYRPERAYEVHVRRLAREQELAAHLVANPSDRTRLKDFVAARYLYWELQDYVAEIAPEFGITSTEFYRQGKEWLTAFVTGVSSAAVHMALTEANFRNRDKAWKGNDIYDADAMASAVPYCDVVMTDAHVARQIADAEAVRRHGTLVFSKPDELLRSLPDLVAARMASTESNASLG